MITYRPDELQQLRTVNAVLRHRLALVSAWSIQLSNGPVQDGTQLIEGLRAILDGRRDGELELIEGGSDG